LGYLQAGVDGLKRLSDNNAFNIILAKASSVYETPPWGIDNTPAYLNAAMLLEIVLDTKNSIDTSEVINIFNILNNLLRACQAIEAQANRQRIVGNQFAARTLDIDILYAVYQCRNGEDIKDIKDITGVTEVILNTEHLTIPHPRLALRAFALKPALDIWSHTPSKTQFMTWYQTPEVQRDAGDVVLKSEYTLY
jgi:2-amino-4-hydroxy-6-hydroxymethyldihydropteridine diphosphokinase